MIVALALAAALVAPPVAPPMVPDGRLIADDAACFTIAMTRDGVTRPMGVTWQTITQARQDGRAVLKVVVHQRIAGGAFDMEDRFVLDAATLRPIQFDNFRKGQPHVSLRYGATRIEGEIHEPQGVRAISEPLSGPVWEGNLFGVLFAALPLEAGAELSVPTYQYDRGFGALTLKVKGLETVATPEGPVEAWVVDAGSSAERRADYLISRAPRRELGYRAPQGGQTLGGDCSALR